MFEVQRYVVGGNKKMKGLDKKLEGQGFVGLYGM